MQVRHVGTNTSHDVVANGCDQGRIKATRSQINQLKVINTMGFVKTVSMSSSFKRDSYRLSQWMVINKHAQFSTHQFSKTDTSFRSRRHPHCVAAAYVHTYVRAQSLTVQYHIDHALINTALHTQDTHTLSYVILCVWLLLIYSHYVHPPTHPPTCFSYQEWHRKGLGFTTLAIKNGIYRKGLGFTTYVYVTSRTSV